MWLARWAAIAKHKCDYLYKLLNRETERADISGIMRELHKVVDAAIVTSSEQIGEVAVELLATLKAEKLKVDQWQDKEATRDAVRLAIKDFLWSDQTGLPADYDETEVQGRAEEVYRHVYRVYPVIPSPYFERDIVV